MTNKEFDQKQVVILSVPYCEPYPLVAPALLASCLEKNGIDAIGVDFNIKFLDFLSKLDCFTEFKNLLTIGNFSQPTLEIAHYKKIIKFTKKFIDNIIKRYNPDYLGLSIFTSESLDFGMILSYVIRKWFPHLKIMVGGKGLEVKDIDGIKHYEKWSNNNIADLVIVGDAEYEIVESLKQKKTGLVFAKKQTKDDLDNIPQIAWSNYNLNEYENLLQQDNNKDHKRQQPYLTVTASKGCVRQCTFCDVKSFWPEFLYRDPDKVAEEIIHNYRSTGIKNFQFTDNLINGSVSNFRRMNEILATEIPYKIEYHGYAIFRGKHQMPEEDFKLASIAGSKSWSVGIESGSERLRNEMKKKFSDDDLDHSISMLLKYDIQQKWLLMVGYPSETEQDFQKTKELIIRYKQHAHNKKIIIQVTPTFVLLNNSPLLQDISLAEKYGVSHVSNAGPLAARFWTSTKNKENNFETRSRWWKELIALIEHCGYTFGGGGMLIQKWKQEIEHFDRIYAEQKKL